MHFQRPPHERKNVGSFWWKDIMALVPSFLLMMRCKVNCGFSVSFWNDYWDVGIVKTLYPQLFSFARYKNALLANSFHGKLVGPFLPLSHISFEQFKWLKNSISALHLLTQDFD
jgi:hypothetical protein